MSKIVFWFHDIFYWKYPGIGYPSVLFQPTPFRRSIVPGMPLRWFLPPASRLAPRLGRATIGRHQTVFRKAPFGKDEDFLRNEGVLSWVHEAGYGKYGRTDRLAGTSRVRRRV